MALSQYAASDPITITTASAIAGLSFNRSDLSSTIAFSIIGATAPTMAISLNAPFTATGLGTFAGVTLSSGVFTGSGSGLTAIQPGGFMPRVTCSGTSYVITGTQSQVVGVTAITAPGITITLPAASTAGQTVTIMDESGTASGAKIITVTRAGSDLIEGQTSFVVTAAYGAIQLVSNGSGLWVFSEYETVRVPVIDTAYTATSAKNLIIAFTTITTARVVTLPVATISGQVITVIDESGSCSASNTITVTRSGSDTINGATTFVLNAAYDNATLVSNGAGKWTVKQDNNGLTITATTGTLTIAAAKTLTVNKTITLDSSTDGLTLNIGPGGTLGTAAFTASTAYQAAGTSVTSLTIATANGFQGSSGGGTTPALTLQTSITGILKGSGNALMAATSGDLTTLLGLTPFANPMSAVGDLIAGGTSGAATRVVAPAVNGTYGLSEVVVASTSVAPLFVLGTGTGSPVFATSPTLVTPNIGVATATTPSANDNSTNVATTAWVQTNSASSGLVKVAARACVSSGNITIANPGTSTFDGVVFTPSAGWRLLLTAQTLPAQNGLWVFNTSATALTRPTDYPAAGTTQCFYGLQLAILSGGTTNGSSNWYVSTANPITIDTTGVTFTEFSSASSASNIAGGAAGNLLVQTASGVTNFVTNANYAVVYTDGSGVPHELAGAAGVLIGNAGAIPAWSTAPTGLSINHLAITDNGVGTQALNIANNATLATTGAYTVTLAASAASTVTMPASTSAVLNYYTVAPAINAVSYAGAISGLQAYTGVNSAAQPSFLSQASSAAPAWTSSSGSGNVVLVTSATLVTPTLGVATATSINGLTVTTTAGTLTIANSAAASLVTTGAFAITLAASAASSVTMPASTSAIMNYITANPATANLLAYSGAASGLVSYVAAPSVLSVLTQTTNAAAPAWVTATGTGAPVLGTSPTISGATFSGSGSLTGTINVPSGGILTVAAGATFTSATTPSNANDIVTKGYVDLIAQSLQQKPTARLATAATLNGTQAYTYVNGTAGSGATLTNNGTKAALVIDGVTCTVGDVVLVMSETSSNAPYNGLYTVTTVGTGAVNWVLTRHIDMDVNTEYTGAFIPVGPEGTGNKNTLWLCSTTGAITVGTTSIAFTQLNGATDLIQGTGISISGNTIALSNQITAAGPVGSATSVPVITYNAQGQLTTVTATNIQLNSVNLSSFTTSGTGTVLALTAGPTFTGNTTVATVNNLTINGGTATLTLVTGSSIITTGAYATTLAASATGTITLPGVAASTVTYYTSAPVTYAMPYAGGASGLLTYLAGPTVNGTYGLVSIPTASIAVAPVWVQATGTGAPVHATSPTLVTPALGVATATSINSLTISTSVGTLTIANNAAAVVTHAGNFAQTFTATAASSVTMPASTSAVLNYYTAAPATFAIPYAGAASGLITYLASPTVNGTYILQSVPVASAAVAPIFTLATGSGSPVCATTPTLVTPVLGAATATSINGLIITTTAGTLTLANSASASLITTGAFAITLAATAASTVTMPASTSAVLNYYTAAPVTFSIPYAGAASGLLTYLASPTTNGTYGLQSVPTAGAAVAPIFTLATGTGAPVCAVSPSIATLTTTGLHTSAAITASGLITANLGLTVTGAKTILAPTVAGYASLNIANGVVPTTPATGDIWAVGGNLYYYTGSTTVTLNTPTPYATTFGDGAATTYTITHNLGTTDVMVSIWELTGLLRDISNSVDIRMISTTQISLNFYTAPASNALRVIVFSH